MSSADAWPSAPRAGAWLRLARISNAPTVVSDVVAGAVVVSAGVSARVVAVVAVAMVLHYTAGMVANDVLDLEVDRGERPERPLPCGEVSVRAAVAVVVALFAAGELLLVIVSPRAALAGVGLVGLIVLYDAWHKDNPWSAGLMGACRAMVYVVAALAVTGAVPGAVWAAAAVLAAYVVGLTQVAKIEGSGALLRWPVVAVLIPAAAWATALPSAAVAVLLVVFVAAVTRALQVAFAHAAPGRAVGSLIAAIALVDALGAAGSHGSALAVAVCVVAFGVTHVLQTRVAGT